jgi:predicted DNA-binding ribbon-helix-helix protein
MRTTQPGENAAVPKRSVAIAGRKTSFSAESAFWEALKEIARNKNMTLVELVNLIAKDHRTTNLSSAIRVYIVAYYQDAVAKLSPPR